MRLSVVLPCYNEEQVLPETHRRLTELTAKWLRDGLIDDYELLFVDDGSRDRTLELLRGYAAADTRVKVLSFSANFGHQPAILAGMHHATGDAVVTLDADLQDPPETIEAMLAKVREGYELVYGVRRSREQDTFFKRATARGFYRLMRWMGVPVIFDHADFRLMTRPVLDRVGAVWRADAVSARAFPVDGLPPLRGGVRSAGAFCGRDQVFVS